MTDLKEYLFSSLPLIFVAKAFTLFPREEGRKIAEFQRTGFIPT